MSIRLAHASSQIVQAGYHVFASGGNFGADASLFSPAHLEDVFAIGALDESDEPASFSNFGQAIDYWAPGTNINAARFNENAGTR